MSRLAPFVDAARPVDRTDLDTTFISYTHGARRSRSGSTCRSAR